LASYEKGGLAMSM